MFAEDRPSGFNLAHVKKEAKRLLRACRRGEVAAISDIQRVLPRLARLAPAQIVAAIQLADVHQALALQRGFTSWADLVRHGDPLSRLLAAVRGGHQRTLQRDLRDFFGLADVSVHAACALGDSRALARSLQRDPSLATVPRDQWPPLMYVCASPLARFSVRHATSLAACAELLLNAGADPNATVVEKDASSSIDTPAIMRALMSGNLSLFVLLKNRGAAEPHRAIQQWFATRVGVGPDAVDLHKFFGEYFRRPDVQERFRIAQAEVRAQGGPPHAFPADPREMQHLRMPNMLAARAHLWAALLDRGYDPTAMGTGGQSALHTLVTYAPEAFVEEFLSRGGNPHVRDDQGRSVIAAAVRAGNLEVADLLRAHGVVDDSTPMDNLLGACLDCDAGHARQLAVLHPHLPTSLSREDIDTVVRAAGRGDVEQVRLMLDVGIRADERNEAGATALHQAAWRGQVAVLRLLLDRSASVAAKDDLYRETPREWALHGSLHAHGARDRCLEIAQLLADAERAATG